MERDFKKQSKAIGILTLLILMSCQEPVKQVSTCVMPDQQNQLSNNANDQDETRICTIPEREENANLEVNAILQDFTPEKEQKMQEALRRMKVVINSKKFKEDVLAHTYEGQRMFVDSNGLSNEEVYEVIMRGVETLNGDEDEEIDVDITLYYANNSTVGYTYPNVNRIWVNDKFFTTNSYGKVAANIVHEWTHKLGFDHAFNRTNNRNFSVPYGVQKIIENLVDTM